jgi:conjugal transfer/type IV secretion protein DotA/TraY
MYSQPDPVRGLVDFGHNIIIASEIFLSTTAALELNAYIAKGVAASADGAAEQLGPLGAPVRPALIATQFALDLLMKGAEKISELVFMLLVFGIVLAFWIPSIPMIHWISGLVGFFIVFMHAMILTPLLGLAHLISGDKGFLNSHTHHGYMAIIQLFIYLPVMVFSFFVSYLILTIGAKLLQIIFVPFITTMSNDNVAGIVTFIVMTALFIIINIQIFNRCFALITTIPEKTGKFLGGGDEMLGDHDSGGSKNSFVAVAGGISQAGSPTKASTNKSSKSINSQVM